MLKDEMKKIGKRGTMAMGKFSFEVKILDVQNFYGRVRYSVTPVAGDGVAWVEKVSVK